MLESSGEMTPPCGVPVVVAPLPLLHHTCREPLPQQLQHPPIRDTPATSPAVWRDRCCRSSRGYPHPAHGCPPRPMHAERFQRLRRAPPRPKAIRRGAEICLEDRLQHDRGRHLHHPVSHRRNAERPLPAIGLRDVSPQDRLRTIRAACNTRRARRACAPHRTARPRRASLDRRPPRRGSFHPPPCLPQDVTPPDPIHQGMEAALRGSLGRDPESALQLAHFVDRRTVHRGELEPDLPAMPSRVLAPST